MTPAFTVGTSSHFERLATAQLKKHSEFAALLGRAIGILQIDPYNQSRNHAVKKLAGPQTEGPMAPTGWAVAVSLRHRRSNSGIEVLRPATGRYISLKELRPANLCLRVGRPNSD